MKRIILPVLLAAICLCACNASGVHRLPPVGEVIYCQHCDTDLYYRVAGTSRTAFRRADYVPASFDVPVPRPGMETICPVCHREITTLRADGLLQTQYRKPAGVR